MCLVLANVVGTVPQDDVHEADIGSGVPGQIFFSSRKLIHRKGMLR